MPFSLAFVGSSRRQTVARVLFLAVHLFFLSFFFNIPLSFVCRASNKVSAHALLLFRLRISTVKMRARASLFCSTCYAIRSVSSNR